MYRDLVSATVLFGLPAIVIYALGRLVPVVGALCAVITTVLVFLFVATGCALSGISPWWLATALGPPVGLAAATWRARGRYPSGR